MQRQEAIKRASKFLGKKGEIKTNSTAKKIKDRAKKNPDLNRGALTQVMADVFQRGLRPKDIDLQKIDFSLSYNNIRGQVRELAQKQGGKDFQVEKNRKMRSGMDKAESMARNARSEMIESQASFIERGNPQWSRFVDQSKQAQKEFSKPFTKEEYRKWRRNQDKYDMEGIDSKRPRDERVKVEKYPFQQSNKSRIKEMMMENALSDGIGNPQNRYADKLSKKEIVSKRNNSRSKSSKMDKLNKLEKLKSSKKLGKSSSNSSKFSNLAEKVKKQGKSEYLDIQGKGKIEKSIFSGPNESKKEREINTENYAKKMYSKGKGDKVGATYSNSSSGKYIERKKREFF